MTSCPLPRSRYEKILLGHGSGGKLSADLLQRIILPAFENPTLNGLEDQAILKLPVSKGRLAFTTDSFVVKPIFFPGGDIGKLAVHGTINDLAVGGAKPLFLSAAFILEEGFAIDDLDRIVKSMSLACKEAHVELVTGDTKVVDRGKGDQIFITTSGVGWVPETCSLSIANAQPGDHVLVSGTVGDHGIAILSVREGTLFETPLQSDTAPLTSLAQLILEVCPETRCMRDPTRGGVASTLNELAIASNVGVKIQEAAVPLKNEVKAACEMLGLDPLYVANEGKLIAVVPSRDSEKVLAAMRNSPLGAQSMKIGEIVEDHPKRVTIQSRMGAERIVTLLTGEQLPRIC